MIPLIDTFQRIAATVLVASLYILPASMGSLMGQLEAEVSTVATPERFASYVMSLPAVASAPAQAEPKKPEPREQRNDVLGVEGGVPISSNHEQTRSSESSSSKKTKNRGKGKGNRKARCMASTGQITATGGNKYRVERALLDYYFGHTDEASRVGSATWYREDDGDIAGIRVVRVRCGGPVEEAGLKRGDIIRTANGKKVDSMAGVIALWWQLRTKDSVKLVITREGRRKRLVYSLV
jgi:membrane-associated protease RseP (regulator of RpoE activity)